MNQSEKPPVVQQALQSVLGAFGLETPVDVQPAGGTASPKWSVRSAGGRFLVRIRAAEFADRESVRFDHDALGRLKKAGLPVPTPLATADGATWLSLDGRVYEVLQWVDGEPFDETDLDAVHEVGALLARFHRALAEDVPPGKEGRRREDHPDLLEPYLVAARKLEQGADWCRQLDEVARQLDLVRHNLDAGLYASLPHSLIHGDFHPGNVRFRGSIVAAIYDFDYLNVQARARDVSDGLMFFAAGRDVPLDPDDIRSLTQPFSLDRHRCRVLLRGYESMSPLTDSEWLALPLLVRSRWLQMRLRGSRKVLENDKVSYVLDELWEVIDWLDHEASEFFDDLRTAS